MATNELVMENTDINGEADLPKWKLAKYGLSLLINNREKEAEALFKRYPDNLQMFAGYASIIFIDALMTFEDDKLAEALAILKETERKCTSGTGWLKSVKTKVFGNESGISRAEEIESQIILADSQLCIAILTVLQADITGYFKGGWVLRKSWKIYQQTYKEITELYKKIVGDPDIPELEETVIDEDVEAIEDPALNTPCANKTNGYIQNRKFPHSQTTTFHPICPSENDPSTSRSFSSLKKSISFNSTLSKGRSKLFGSNFSSSFSSTMSLSFLKQNFNFFTTDNVKDDIDKETITRLMGAVSFGYGLFQLGISLLPPSLLKLSNILGFGGNRNNGIACLMYARLCEDMRAPLATLALLWYHTIVRPFYALDGSNVEAGVEASIKLIEESEAEYKESALFLFFRGRVKRLSSQIPEALESFKLSAENSTQRELKILSMHEVGWCHLIQLEYFQAENSFQYLKSASRWSRSFYIYLASICMGSCGNLKDVVFLQEMKDVFDLAPRGSQLEEFLQRRFKLYPKDGETLERTEPIYWKLLVYEVLYLWNTLPSCSTSSIEKIIADCTSITDERTQEPMLGLSEMIEGICHCLTKNFEAAVTSFKKCLDLRKDIVGNSNDAHVSAFSQFELGALLTKTIETREEGKQLLQQLSQFKGYDFEQRLNVRVHMILKNL